MWHLSHSSVPASVPLPIAGQARGWKKPAPDSGRAAEDGRCPAIRTLAACGNSSICGDADGFQKPMQPGARSQLVSRVTLRIEKFAFYARDMLVNLEKMLRTINMVLSDSGVMVGPVTLVLRENGVCVRLGTVRV
jgi:hypothetical protein